MKSLVYVKPDHANEYQFACEMSVKNEFCLLIYYYDFLSQFTGHDLWLRLIKKVCFKQITMSIQNSWFKTFCPNAVKLEFRMIIDVI